MRPRGSRERWASDHERARHRAAERLSLPLPAAENAWLDRHLRTCAACAAVAAEYGTQQADLRGLAEPLPPRDLWARTSAALDRADRQARDLPSGSVFPGRGGRPGSRGSRSIRGLRAEQRAAAFRSTRAGTVPLRADPRRTNRPPGLGWLAPFGALAALAIVIVVGGSTLLTSGLLSPARLPLATASVAVNGAPTPLATPIQVGAGEVAWLTLAADGTYSLNFASVDEVCPANVQPDCAPIAPASPRHLPAVRTTLHTVLRDPSHRNLVVVTSGTKKGTGGSVMVVAVPSDTPAATPSPSSAPTPGAPATPSASAAVVSTIPSANTSAGTPSDSPSSVTPVPPASAVDSSVPASTATAAPTESAAPFATPQSASPAVTATGPAGPTGASPSETPMSGASDSATPSQPEPTATALAIISDVVVVGETAAYSPDGTMLAFSARPADGSQGPDIYLWRVGDSVARPMTTDHASVFSGWLSNQLLGSRAVDGAGQPASSGALASASPGEPGPGTPFAVPGDSAPASSEASASASDSPAPSDAAGESAGSTDDANAGAATAGFLGDSPASALPRSFVLDPATGVETDLAAPAWRPVVDPTGRFVAYWAGSLRYDASTLTWLPDRGALVLAAWPAVRGTDPNVTLVPVPLLENGGTSVPAGEWDIRWDESGTHIAVWAADANNPELGRLTLLTVDASGRIDPNGVSLHDTPALAGFSMGSDRLAWATPPGQDGEGSRLQVLAWSGENAGKIDSQPVPGEDALVVVR